jgi:hypothetical protein
MRVRFRRGTNLIGNGAKRNVVFAANLMILLRNRCGVFIFSSLPRRPSPPRSARAMTWGSCAEFAMRIRRRYGNGLAVAEFPLWRDLVHRAIAIRASEECRAIEIARAVGNESSVRTCPKAWVTEEMEDRLCPVRSNLEHCPASINSQRATAATINCCAIKIASTICDETGDWVAAVSMFTCEEMENRFGTVPVQA